MRFLGMAVVFGAAALPSIALSVDNLPGHRAVYALSPADGSDGVVSAKGRYVFDLEYFCDGYTLNERLVLQMVQRGNEALTDYRLSAFESDEGDVYRFSSETSFNGEVRKSSEGTLSVGSDDAKVDFKSADDVEFDNRVLAPLAHLKAVIAAAREGKDRHASQVFDGDTEKPVFYSVTRIAPAKDSGTERDVTKGLQSLERWSTDSVYFPPEDAASSEATPDFSFTGTIHENGVVTDLVLDYGDFALNAELEELTLYDAGCG